MSSALDRLFGSDGSDVDSNDYYADLRSHSSNRTPNTADNRNVVSEGMRAELEEAATGQGPDAAILQAIRTTQLYLYRDVRSLASRMYRLSDVVEDSFRATSHSSQAKCFVVPRTL